MDIKFPNPMSTSEVVSVLNESAHLSQTTWQWRNIILDNQIVTGWFLFEDDPFSVKYSHFEAEAIAEKYLRFGTDKAYKINQPDFEPKINDYSI